MVNLPTKSPLCYSRFLLANLATVIMLASCGGSSDDISDTTDEAPATVAPAASVPETNALATNTPVTNAPVTNIVNINSGIPSSQVTSQTEPSNPVAPNAPLTQTTPVSPPEQSSDSSDLESTEVTQDTDAQNSQRTMRILPLGDSITNGGAGYPSYRRSLWFMLRNGDYNVDFIGSQRGFSGPVSDYLKDFDLDHEGHWAWEMGQLENSLPDWINNYTPDIVLLHAGTNDVARGQSHSSTISELNNIIDILRNKNANVVVLLAKIIPMRNRDTADFNEFIESFAASKTTTASPVVIVDQYEGYNPSSDNHDNYHPNERGEEKMATRWLNALEPYLH